MQKSTPSTLLLVFVFCLSAAVLFSLEKEVKKPDWWDDDSIKKEIQKSGITGSYGEVHGKVYRSIWGFLREWEVVGPFDYPDSIGFDASYPPQDGYVKGGKYTGQGRKQVTWTKMTARNSWDNYIDMRKLGRKAIVYAHTAYSSDRERETRIWFRARDYITIWVNRMKVYESMDSPQDINSNYADIKLKKGDNNIMIKVAGTGRSHDFWFEVRIADKPFFVTETMYYKAMFELFPKATPQEREYPYYCMARNLGKMRYFDLAHEYFLEYRKINKEFKNYGNLAREMTPWYSSNDTGATLKYLEFMKELEKEYSQKTDEIAKDVGAYHNVIRHIGNLAREIGEYDTAIKYYKKMVARNQNLISRLSDQCTLGLTYCYVADYAKAKEQYDIVKGFYKDEKQYRNVKYPLRDLSRYAKDPKSTTQLNDNAGINRYILVGEQYVDSGELSEAVKQFQSTLEKFGSALYEASAGHYISATALCRLNILNLGAEGIKAYRDEYDGKAGKLYEKARFAQDKDKMLEVALTYPVSGLADNALYELGNMFLQEGKLGRASLVFGRLLEDYPDSEIKKREIQTKYAFCLKETGMYTQAKKLINDIKDAKSKEDFEIGGEKLSSWNYTQKELADLKTLDPDPEFAKSIKGMALNPAAGHSRFPSLN